MSRTARRKNKRRTPAAQSEPSLARGVLTGLAVCVLGASVLLFLVSAAVYSTPDPGSLALPAALALLYISAFAGGLTASFKNRGEPVACGLLTGGGFFLILIMLSFLLPGGSSGLGFWMSAGLHLLSVAFAILGGMAGISLRRTGGRRRKIHRR